MNKIFFIITLLLTSVFFNANAQVKYNSASSKTSIDGTSTLHDWQLNSENGTVDVLFNLEGNSITNMASLVFSVKAETLKSDHKGLDKNAYKALRTEKYPSITFSSNSASIRPNGANNYIITTKGKLTISGITKEVLLAVNCSVNPADMSIHATGSYRLKMTDYTVEPPSFMFGAMKTGDEVTIKFNMSLKKA